MPDPLHERSSGDIGSAARMASLPVDILADPDELNEGGSIAISSRDVVRPERVSPGHAVVAGWGERAWRTRLAHDESALIVGAPEPPVVPAASSAAWHSRAHEVLDGHWADGTDDQTRSRVIGQLLELPLADLRQESRSLRVLLASHRSLRHAARRVLLQAVAQHHLGLALAPDTRATWQVLARLTRTPSSRLAGDVHRGALLHDLRPQCPTARRWLDE